MAAAEPQKRSAPATDTTKDESPRKKRPDASEYALSEIVTVVVGPERKKFAVHKDILCAESGFFTEHINSCMKEAKNTEVELLEDRPEAFGFILNYLYDNAFRTKAPPARFATLDSLVHSWMLADRLGMEDGQNAVMDVVQATITKAPDSQKLVRQGLRMLQLLKTKPARTSSLHRFLVDRFAWDMKSTKTHLTTQSVPKLINDAELFFKNGGGIVVDVFNAFMLCMENRLFGTGDPSLVQDCSYHEHKDGNRKACWRYIATSTKPESAPNGRGSLFGATTQNPSYNGGGLFGTAPNTSSSTTQSFGFGLSSSNASGGHLGSGK